MSFTDMQLDELRSRVCVTLGQKRFSHTLGVEQAAIRLGLYLCPEDVSELRCAAILHDVTKELSPEEQSAILSSAGITDPDDLTCVSVHHSLTAPYVIKREFPQYATERVLSAVYKHTTGDSAMSVFDMIIFIADYIEDGRTYSACVDARDRLYGALDKAECTEDMEAALLSAVLTSLENTVESLTNRRMPIHRRTLLAAEGVRRRMSSGSC